MMWHLFEKTLISHRDKLIGFPQTVGYMIFLNSCCCWSLYKGQSSQQPHFSNNHKMFHWVQTASWQHHTQLLSKRKEKPSCERKPSITEELNHRNTVTAFIVAGVDDENRDVFEPIMNITSTETTEVLETDGVPSSRGDGKCVGDKLTFPQGLKGFVSVCTVMTY